jgi:UDP-N-acetylmuramate: L-alanyl-gamma-D-glutamyl-meso-diaminopimelate ligase
MGGIAALAKTAGYEVTGCDAGVYPPMSTQLKKLGIDIHEGFDAGQLESSPDCVVVGNVVSRGFEVVESMLDRDMPYQSGPQWLAEHVLRGQHVFAAAGTHGKTTTASLLAWILEDAGLQPGFLIGGVPANFGVSARYGGGDCFVVEADEYDTAFFDKRAKFVHYRPRTLILNNLEYDHADIYKDLDAIMWQFHQLLRTVPGSGRVIVNAADENIRRLVDMGCWTPRWMPCRGSRVSSGAWSVPRPWVTSRSMTILPITPPQSGARSPP